MNTDQSTTGGLPLSVLVCSARSMQIIVNFVAKFEFYNISRPIHNTESETISLTESYIRYM